MGGTDGWSDPNLSVQAEHLPVDSFFDDYLSVLRNEGALKLQGMVLPRFVGIGVPSDSTRYVNEPLPADGGQPSTSAELAAKSSPTGGSTGMFEERTTKLPKPKRTSKQYEQNKKAQKRYREKQKQRTAELERSVAQLTARVKVLEAVQEEKLVLQDRNKQLEHALQLRNTEIDDLQKFMEMRATTQVLSNSDDAMKPSRSEMDFGHVKNVASVSSTDIAEADWTPESIGSLHKLWTDHLEKIKVMVEMAEKEHKAISAQDIPGELVDNLRELVSGSISLCIAVHRCEGPNVKNLVNGCITRFKAMGLEDNGKHWTKVASALYLPPEKLFQVLDSRQRFLEKLESIFEKRRQLNCTALTMQACDLQVSSAGAVSGSCLHRAASRAELSGVLDELKENLRQEQRTLSEFTVTMLGGILDPFQAAVLIANAHPFHMDVVAVSNVFAQHAQKLLEENLILSRKDFQVKSHMEPIVEAGDTTAA